MHMLLAGVVLGILLAHTCEAWRSFGYVAMVLTGVMLLRMFVLEKQSRAYRLWKQGALVFCGCAVGAILSTQYHDAYRVKQNIVLACANSCTFHGMVVSRPESVERGLRYEVQLLSMNNETLIGTYAVGVIPKIYSFTYGDTLSFDASVRTFEPFQSDTGRVVAYDKIMQSKNIHVDLDIASVQQTGHVSSLTRLSVGITDMFIGALTTALPEPMSGLAQGVTFGVRGALDDESETLFRMTGLSHITVFSGSNVAILLAGVWFLTGSFPYMVRVLCSLSVLLGVLVGVGISPPTLRAGIMGALYLVARAVGKSSSGLAILTGSVLCMLLVQPDSLLYDLSFQLSVLAVVALMTIAIPIERGLQRYVPHAAASLIAMTVSVLLGVAPWIAYVFGTFSPSSLVANIVVVPLVPIALTLALLCAVVVVSFPVLMPIVAYPTEALYALLFTIAESCAALPYSSIELPPFHGVYVCIWYAALIVWYVTMHHDQDVSLGQSRFNH